MQVRTSRTSRGYAAAIVAGLLAALGGCGETATFAPLSDFVTTSPKSDAGGGPVPDFGPSAPPPCNLGPEGGVCACADELTINDPPTIYFVLDRSGSMQTDNKWVTIIRVIGQLVADLGPRAKVGAAVFPGPGAIEATQCLPGSEVFAPQQGSAPAGYFGATATQLTRTLLNLAAFGGTPTAATLTSLTPYLRSLGPNTFVVLATDGAPNCNATASCDVANCQLTNASTNCVPPVNCCTQGNNESCNDTDPTLAAIRALAAPASPSDGGAASADDAAADDAALDGGDDGDADAGAPASSGPPAIPVYVVGVPGSAPYAEILTEMAVAGGTARTDPSASAAYYAVSSTDQQAFVSALSAVAAQITGTCTLQLDAEPDAGAVNLFFDGTAVPQTSADGSTAWTLDGTTVTVLGAACDAIMKGSVLDVRVVVGCPTVIR
jgi:hypothetical protein